VSSSEQVVVTCSGGRVRFIYSDTLAPLLAEGDFKITRASHVEPTDAGEWTADMSPVGGPVLGPFPLREIALSAEVAWLRENRGL
jgi:hypothetical protein